MGTLKTTCVLVSILLYFSTAAEEKPNVEVRPLSLGGAMEMGQLVNSRFYMDPESNYNGTFIPRLGISLSHHVTVEENLDIQVGVGGLFWYAFYRYEELDFGWWIVPTKFGPGISKAHATYTFGDPHESSTWLRSGFIPLKYNPEATNLGEYLYRSSAYPGHLFTGGWTIVNSAGYMGLGFQFHFENLGGDLKHDLTLFFERDLPPFGDLSPTYLASLSAGPFELGAGISLHHYIPIRPSKLQPKIPENHYVEYPYFPAVYDKDSVLIPAGSMQGIEKDIESYQDATVAGRLPGSPRDTVYVDIATRSQYLYNDDPLFDAALYEPVDNHRTGFYYTHRGIKLMGRLTYNLTEVVGSDCKLFAEAAVLGVKDYAYLYDNIAERIPVMFGMNIPTFGLLDILSLQGEYRKSPWTNSIGNMYELSAPIPKRLPEYREDHADYAWDLEGDDFHWSVFARKTLMPGLRLYAQAASDHLRLIRWEGTFTFEPQTSKSNQWYYMARIEFGI